MNSSFGSNKCIVFQVSTLFEKLCYCFLHSHSLSLFNSFACQRWCNFELPHLRILYWNRFWRILFPDPHHRFALVLDSSIPALTDPCLSRSIPTSVCSFVSFYQSTQFPLLRVLLPIDSVMAVPPTTIMAIQTPEISESLVFCWHSNPCSFWLARLYPCTVCGEVVCCHTAPCSFWQFFYILALIVIE